MPAYDVAAQLSMQEIPGGTMEAAFNTNPTYLDASPKIGCAIPTSAGRVAGLVEQGDGQLNLVDARGTTEEKSLGIG